MNERVAEFGAGDEPVLVGIESVPADPPGREQPAVILLNAGVVPHVGPHRLSVNLARRLARAGFHVLRFDLAGLGDSRSRPTTPGENPSVEDCRAAMDYLARATGAERFVLGGLCSGADNSLRTALVDPRVVGAILLDPPAYRTPGFYFRKVRARAADLDTWKRLLLQRPRRLLRGLLTRFGGPPSPDGAIREQARQLAERQAPPKSQFVEALQQILQRGGRALIVYTAGVSATYNHPGQFDEAFRAHALRDRVDCRYWPDVNHMFTVLATQERLCAAVTEWMLRSWS